MIEISGKNYPTLSDIIKVPEGERNSVDYLGMPGVFLVISSSVKKSMGSGLKYSDAVVSDKNSRVKVKIWGEVKNSSLIFANYEYSKDYRSFSLNPISVIDGNSRPDLLEIMMPHFDVSGYVEILDSMIESVDSAYLKQLLKVVFDKDGETYSLFLKATAASNNHHVGVGGLLFHTISVAKLAIDISSNYPVDKDMVLTGALLHDIGKIYTYTSGPDFEYTDDGKLENHIVIGIKILTRAIDKIPDFPKYLEMILIHVISSHHGALEFGSPVVPKIPEAIVVHFADEIDAKMRTISDTLEVTEEGWTDRNQFLGTEFFKWRLS